MAAIRRRESPRMEAAIGAEQITTLALMLIHMALCFFFESSKWAAVTVRKKKTGYTIDRILGFLQIPCPSMQLFLV